MIINRIYRDGNVTKHGFNHISDESSLKFAHDDYSGGGYDYNYDYCDKRSTSLTTRSKSNIILLLVDMILHHLNT